MFAVVAVAPDLEGILGKIEQLIFFPLENLCFNND